MAQKSVDFSSRATSKDAKICCRRAYAFDSLAAKPLYHNQPRKSNRSPPYRACPLQVGSSAPRLVTRTVICPSGKNKRPCRRLGCASLGDPYGHLPFGQKQTPLPSARKRPPLLGRLSHPCVCFAHAVPIPRAGSTKRTEAERQRSKRPLDTFQVSSSGF